MSNLRAPDDQQTPNEHYIMVLEQENEALKEELEAYKVIMLKEVRPLAMKICSLRPTEAISNVESEAYILSHHQFVLNADVILYNALNLKEGL